MNSKTLNTCCLRGIQLIRRTQGINGKGHRDTPQGLCWRQTQGGRSGTQGRQCAQRQTSSTGMHKTLSFRSLKWESAELQEKEIHGSRGRLWRSSPGNPTGGHVCKNSHRGAVSYRSVHTINTFKSIRLWSVSDPKQNPCPFPTRMGQSWKHTLHGTLNKSQASAMD